MPKGISPRGGGVLVVCLLAAIGCGTRTQAADFAYGQYLSGECATCHRADGQDKGIPAIVGWPPEQFVAVLKSYKVKDRPNAVMQTIAAKFTDADMAALAAYYASLPVRSSLPVK